MFVRFYQSLVLALVVGLAPLFVMASPAAALPKTSTGTGETKPAKIAKVVKPVQPTIATKPEEAKGPVAGWLLLDSQKTHWYKFNYHYHNQGKNSEPTQAIVKLTAKAKGCLIFEVWTQGGLQAGNGQKHKPVGVGSPMKGLGRVLVWVGGSTASETYYIAVKNKANKTCPYQLAISGPDVSY